MAKGPAASPAYSTLIAERTVLTHEDDETGSDAASSCDVTGASAAQRQGVALRRMGAREKSYPHPRSPPLQSPRRRPEGHE